MSDIHERIASLSPARRKLLEQLLARESTRPSEQTIPALGRDTNRFPLSYAQRRLWFIDQLRPGDSFYNMPFALRLRGALDADALAAALSEVVRRHETLRTTFARSGEEPEQLIHPPSSVPLPVVDLSDLPADERETEARRLAAEEARRPFDLSTGPLLRARLLRLSEAEHALLVTLHHIVSDGWSLGVMVRELSALYDAYSGGRPSPLAELPVQYADYTIWQRTHLRGALLDAELSYWKQQLAGAPPLLELPTDFPRPPVQRHTGAHIPFSFDSDLSDGLRRLAVARGATPFMLVLAAFQLLLSRYSGQEDIVVGTPVANRTRAETEGLIGFFVNTLAVRSDLTGNPTFVELLARVREACVAAYAHQEVPFERVVEELRPERSLSHAPVFQVMAAWQNEPAPPLRLSGLELSLMESGNASAKFDLLLGISGGDEDEWRGALEYDSDLFERPTVERMVVHFKTLLQSIVDGPDTRISGLNMLTGAEEHQLLVKWNDTSVSYDAEPSLHRLVERQVARTPSAVAVTDDFESLTYEELNRRANRLARRLRALGAGRESLVGVLLERSVGMVVALLGTLKAGAAYVPLDPSYPPARLAFMLDDARPAVLLTERRLLEHVPPHGAHVVCLDDVKGLEREGDANLPDAAAGESLAYVIYTSGSTGRPKGAMNTHAAIVNRLLWMQDEYRLDGGDVVLQKTPYTFDVSVWEFFWPLLAGARLVLAQPEGHKDADYIADVIESERVTTLHFVPSMLQVFLPKADPARAPTLRRVICSGEALTHELQQRFHERLPCVGLYNLYGPTEAAVDVTHWACVRGGERRSVPIGRPIANTAIYVLDRFMNPVPVGVAGELHIGGAGPARGYLKRPGLTAEKFIPDPFSREPGARLYRTGDLARYLPGGELEFLGRIDQQVKLRGHRVELGEIEAALRRCTSVRDAVVLAKDDGRGDKRLIGYVLAGPGAPPSAAQLQRSLKQELPSHMVPSAFVLLDAWPLLPSGKVDRRALPEPDDAPGVRAGSFVAPRTPVEEVVAGVWADVIGLREVGADDNFFDLGGHSLSGTQAVTRVGEIFRVALPLTTLFESPTVSAFARAVEEALRAGAGIDAPPLRPAARGEALPLSFAQQRLWFMDQSSPGLVAYNVPTALRLEGRLDTNALARAVNEIVRRHESLRTTFPSPAGQPVQLVSESLHVEVPLVDLVHLAADVREAEARRLATEEALRPFDLAEGPLLRVALLRLADEEHVLLFTTHHIVTDGWSQGLLADEFAALYEAYASGAGSPLEELPVQYADYSVWQREWLQGEVLERQLTYWQKRLAGASGVLQLPIDRPRPAVKTYSGATERFTLDAALGAALQGLARREGATLFMVSLAAFKALLQRYADQEDIVVGTSVANRTRREVEPLIGYFVNALVLRTKVEPKATLAGLIADVRETCLGAYAHQDVPFEKLVENFCTHRDLSHTPFFQAVFVLQNTPRGALQLPGLRLSMLEADWPTAKFDLLLTMVEAADGDLRGGVEYNTDLFDAATVKQFVRHFERVLRAFVADARQRVRDLPLLDADERRQLTERWNATDDTSLGDTCVHQLIERQAARTPDAVAVEFEDQRVTYAELNSRADRLALRLRSLGVGPEVRVGLCLGRSHELVIGLLGVLKAGGAYVPLDPALPRERLSFMLEDSGVQVLLTEERLLNSIPPTTARMVCIDVEDDAPTPRRDEVVTAVVASDNLAYVIYTSGSTGRPKGVMIEQRALANYVTWAARAYAADEGEGSVFHSTLGFDLSVTSLFVPLVTGKAVAIVEESVRGLVGTLSDGARRWSLLKLTPAHLELLRETIGAGAAGGRTHALVVGGEALHAAEVRLWREAAPGVRVINEYGPTEATVGCCVYEVNAENAHAIDGRGGVPIGHPIANTRAYVLDRFMQPVPAGVAGELYVGGAGLARGYVNRPALTAERFVPDPFSIEPGQRMYRTGDAARGRFDGEFEFLGRLDDQVKLRGYRIEPGEVEATLRSFAGVAEAAVILRESPVGGKELAAYVSAAQGSVINAAELQEHVKARLPEYMRPAEVVFLDAMPLTPSGKIDRNALSNVTRRKGAHREPPVNPRDHLELQLVQIWEEVLGRSGIGVRDNFFELGGHSLLATRLISKIKKATGRPLNIMSVFEERTIENMARALRRKPSRAPARALVPVQPHGSKRPFFCVHPSGGNVVCYVELSRRLGTEQPFYGLQSLGLDGDAETPSTIEEMAARYLVEVRAAQVEGPYALGGWSMGGLVAYEMARQLTEAGERVELLALFDTIVPPRGRPEEDDAVVLARFFLDLLGPTPAPREITLADLRRFDPEARLGYLFEQARLRNVLPPDIGLEQIRRLLAVFKTNLHASERYTPPESDVPLVLFEASERPAGVSYGPQLGWGHIARAGVRVFHVPGGHYTILSDANVEALAGLLTRCLEESL
ncbi:MAG TPA: amino acid adenylation domain-containing protein [Pyrinomonadaceae bacterium]